jgi:hypothetical protein
MPKSILKKYERSRTPLKSKIVIQPQDIEIFKSLADYRFLDTKQILSLFPGKGGPRYLQRRLQKLFHHGYIDRPPSQISYYRTRGQMIYALGNKGAAAIYERRPEIQSKIDWQQKNREVKFPFLDHALMISDFRVSLALSFKTKQDARLIFWKQGKDLKDSVLTDEGKAVVYPDAFFTIEFLKGQGSGEVAHFFLEADRSTMTQERFLKKMKAYWQWWKEGGHKQLLGINRFRVLTITISEERKENLRRTTAQADEKKQGSEMFLFTCEKSYNFETPETILKPIWQSPKDNSPHHLLE